MSAIGDQVDDIDALIGALQQARDYVRPGGAS